MVYPDSIDNLTDRPAESEIRSQDPNDAYNALRDVRDELESGRFRDAAKLVSAGWYTPRPISSTTVQHGEGLLTAVPLLSPGRGTLDRVACEVTTAGESASLVRLGLYEDNGGPDALLLDAGTVAGDTTGVKSITISTTLTLPRVLWLAGVAQDCPTTAPTLRACAAGEPPLMSPMDAFNTFRSGLYTTGVTGALPDPFGGHNYAGRSFLVNVRAA